MAQADGVVANGTGSAVRSDINNQYAALWSNHSGSTEPSSGKVAYQLWADTNTGYLKIRNAANNAWIQLFKLDGTDLADICRLTGSTNNTITTVTGANAIQGEANLTFDGSTLTHNQTGNNATPKFLIAGSGNDAGDQFQINNYGDGNGDYYGIGVNQGLNASGDWAKDSDTARSAGVILDSRLGRMAVYVSHDGAGQAVRSHSEFDRDGHLKIEDGNLIIGTAGHGIDFSAVSHAGGMTSELLDSYEEGTFTPAYGSALSSVTYTAQAGHYVKTGNCVHLTIKLQLSAATTSGSDLTLTGLPFTTKNDANARGGLNIVYQDNWYSSSSGGTLSQVMVMFGGNSTTGYFYDGDGTAIDANEPYDDCKKKIHFTGMYFTD